MLKLSVGTVWHTGYLENLDGREISIKRCFHDGNKVVCLSKNNITEFQLEYENGSIVLVDRETIVEVSIVSEKES